MTIMQEEIFGPLLPVIGYKRRRRSRSPSSTSTTGRWRCTGSARTTPRATRCWRAPSPAASPSTTACFTSRRSTSRWAASARPAPAPITANGDSTTLSKLKPVFYRSPFNRLADLYPPYGGEDRAAGKDAAVHVVAFNSSLRGAQPTQSPNPCFPTVDMDRTSLRVRPAMTRN